MAAIIVLSFSINSFAVDLDSLEEIPADSGTVSEPEDPYLNMLLNNMQTDIDELNEKVEVIQDDLNSLSEPGSVSDPSAPESVTEEGTEINPDTDMPVDIALYSVAPITPEDSDGLKSIILSILGDYDPVVVEYRYQNSNQTSYQYLREVMPDYPWCASFLIFALMIYCTFRIGGALLHG